MHYSDLIEENFEAKAALKRLLDAVGHGFEGQSFKYSDVENLQMVDDFKLVKMAGLIQFKAAPDWWSPTQSK